MTHSSRLHKSKNNRMLTGVSGGLAEYFEIDPVFVRIGWAVLVFVTAGLALLLYIGMVIIMPKADDGDDGSPVDEEEGVPSNAELSPPPAPRPRIDRARRRGVMGIFLIVVGALFLVSNFGWFWWFSWSTLWPVILIGLGLAILLGRAGRN